MNGKSEQINIRASQQVAEDLRAEAQRRSLPLGETLEQLLALARADRQPGTWVELDATADAALRSVAAAAGVPPATQLARMVRGRLREQLLSLAGNLDGAPLAPAERAAQESAAAEGLLRHAPERGAERETRATPRDSSPAAASADDEESLERVGVFTVFD